MAREDPTLRSPAQAGQAISKEHQALVVKQYEAIQEAAQAHLEKANARLELARAGAAHLIVADW
jgi:hypothetical protein